MGDDGGWDWYIDTWPYVGHDVAMTRTATIKVLVDPEERELIRAAAEKADRSMSDYARLATLERARAELKKGVEE